MRVRNVIPGGLLAAAAAATLLVAGCGSDQQGGANVSSGKGGKVYNVGVVLPQANDEFWQDVGKGAQAADAALPDAQVDVEYGPPPGNFEDMIPVVENLLTKGVDAIVAPGGPQLLPVLQRADKQGIPVVLVATGLPAFKQAKSTIITDNLVGGRRAGEYIKQQLGGKGTLAILDIARGTYPLLDQRAQGVEQALKGTAIKVVSHLDTGCDVSKSVSVMQNILTAHPDVDAVFGACAQAILGAWQAISKVRDPSSIVTVGFDGKAPEFKLIAAGKQDATVAQYPDKMGEMGVKTAVKALQGQQVPANADSGTALVTKANVAQFMK